MSLSHISSDNFCHRNTLRLPKLQQSLILELTYPLQFFYFNQTTNGECVMIPYSLSVPEGYILQSCNGLLLLDPFTNHRLKDNYYVYNPTTRQSRKITPSYNDKFPYVIAIRLAFDPSKSPYYKIVCVRSSTTEYRRSLSSYTYQIEVYDSESHTWNLSFEPFISPDYFGISGNGVYWNNSIYWPDSYHYSIFDIAKNEVKRLDSPRDDRVFRRFHQESNGRLYHVDLGVSDECYGLNTITVWELGGDDHSQWLLKHRGEFLQDSNKVLVIPLRLMVGSDGDETCCLVFYEQCFYYQEPLRMMVYNFLDKSYQLLVDFTGQEDVLMSQEMKGYQFIESMALV